MRAIVQTGPRAVETQDRERPTPGPGEALLRVHAAGVCGSDAHAYRYDEAYEWVPLPRVMGHEYAGEVVAVGDDVTAVAPGDRVVEEPIHACGDCFQCRSGRPNVCRDASVTGLHRDGGYADYVRVAPERLHPVPDDLSLHHAAVAEPTAVAARAVLERSVTAPGDAVLVEGPGPIGILSAAVADALGAEVVVSGLDRDAAHRLPLAANLGLATANVEAGEDPAAAVPGVDRRGGFDVVVDATGAHAGVADAAEQVRRGGQVVVVGVPSDPGEVAFAPLVRGEVDVTTSYGATWTDFERALGLLAAGDVDVDALAEDASVADPAATFESFLAAETCKPLFRFAD